MSAGQGPDSPLDAVLTQLAELADQVAILETASERDGERIDELTAALQGEKESDDKYRPAPAPRWWQIQVHERDEAIARLRAWVDTVFRPGYGHLAAKLHDCWPQHDLCLYYLDWLSESWTVIHHPAKRGVGALWTSLDWHTRFLPSGVAILEAETASCDHLPVRSQQVRVGADPWAGTP